MSERPAGPIIGGSILIAVGLGLMAVQLFGDVAGPVVLPLLGLAFLVGYGFLDKYGLLIPGCIMTGLGIGVVLTENFELSEGVVLLGLGLGFLAIWVVDLLRSKQNRWWPLIPGGIVTVLGAGVVIESARRFVEMYWPVLLVVIGLIIIVNAMRGRDNDTQPPAV